MRMSKGFSNIALGLGIIIVTFLNLTDCDIVTDAPKTKEVYIYQRDGPKDIPEPELLPVLHGNDTRCRISEYLCSNKKCIPINRFCDGSNDCGDSSDEPRHCTRCNKTYYGDIGRTYELELHRPREDLVPYVCLLTITAAGGIHGDLVQIRTKWNIWRPTFSYWQRPTQMYQAPYWATQGIPATGCPFGMAGNSVIGCRYTDWTLKPSTWKKPRPTLPYWQKTTPRAPPYWLLHTTKKPGCPFVTTAGMCQPTWMENPPKEFTKRPRYPTISVSWSTTSTPIKNMGTTKGWKTAKTTLSDKCNSQTCTLLHGHKNIIKDSKEEFKHNTTNDTKDITKEDTDNKNTDDLNEDSLEYEKANDKKHIKDHTEDHTEGSTKDYAETHSKDHNKGHAKDNTKDHAKDNTKDHAKDHAIDHAKTQTKDHSKEHTKDHKKEHTDKNDAAYTKGYTEAFSEIIETDDVVLTDEVSDEEIFK